MMIYIYDIYIYMMIYIYDIYNDNLFMIFIYMIYLYGVYIYIYYAMSVPAIICPIGTDPHIYTQTTETFMNNMAHHGHIIKSLIVIPVRHITSG